MMQNPENTFRPTMRKVWQWLPENYCAGKNELSKLLPGRYVLLLLLSFVTNAPLLHAQMPGYELETIDVEDAEDLQDWLEDPIDFVDIVLAAGEYRLLDLEIDEDAEAVEGIQPILRFAGERLNLRAADNEEVTLLVDAQHPLVFNNCRDCSIRNITIKVVPREVADTNSLISVFNSTVAILEMQLRLGDIKNQEVPADTENADEVEATSSNDGEDDESSTIEFGISNNTGVRGGPFRNPEIDSLTGRYVTSQEQTENVKPQSLVNAIDLQSGARATITGNRIQAFNANALTLAANARGKIRENIIIGSRQDSGAARGQGTAILIRDKATAQVKNNLIKHCYKGIGIRDDADAIVKDNVLEYLTTWGIALWQNELSAPVGMIQHNIIFHTGACGALISLTSYEDGLGLFNENLLVNTGQDERLDAPDLFCYQSPIAVHAAPREFEFSGNTLFANRLGFGSMQNVDVSGEEFELRLPEFCEFFLRKKLFADESLFLNSLCGHEAGMFRSGN